MSVLTRVVPEWIRHYKISWLSVDVLAGVTLAAVAVPEVMGYTSIAQTPVITGLYTIIFPTLVFALLGSSRLLVVGADSATAAILAAGLAGLGISGLSPNSSEWVACTSLVALVCCAMLILARLLRLGFLGDFLSASVLIGFLTGVGISVLTGQLPDMLGIPKGTGNWFEQQWSTLTHLTDASLWTVAFAAGTLVIIVGCKLISRKIPGAVIAVILSIVLSNVLDASSHGVAVIGPVQGGMPPFGLPQGIDLGDIPAVMGVALSCFFLIIAQSAATSRSFAMKHSERVDVNKDILGLAGANIAAGLTGTFVVNGSPTKTEMVDSAGGRSQLAMLTTAACVAIVLLFLTKPLSYMPNAVLAAVVFIIALRLVDVAGMRRILRLRPVEFGIACATAAVVVFVGVEEGIIAAIVLSVIFHLRHSYRPHDRLLVAGPQPGTVRSVALAEGAEALPGLAIYRFGSSLYYANADRFQEELLGLADAADPPLRWLCVTGDAIGDVYYSASDTIRAVHEQLADRGVTLVLCNLIPEVRAELDRDGLTDLLGADHVFDWVDEALAAYTSLTTPPG